jgi:hypothetical protein
MKRSILVLMLVVFALVTVVPTFALSQDFHGIGVPQVIDPNDGIGIPQVVDPNDGLGMPQVVDPNYGLGVPQTIVLDQGSIIAIRKSGGTQQDW